MWEPKPHQQFTTVEMVKNKRFYCVNDIGTMKTASALWAADWLMRLGCIRKVLILAPLSTLQLVWAEHLWMMFPRARSFTTLYSYNKDKRFARLQEDSDFYILNHDGLKVFSQYSGGKVRGDPRRCAPLPEFAKFLEGIDLVIVDEGAVFRNYNTDLYLAARSLLIHMTGPQRGKPNRLGCWWMSGNMAPNAPTDIWAQARCVNPANVPSYFTHFRERTMKKVTQFKWVPRKGWESVAYAMLQPSVRFARKDVLKDLPPEIWETRRYELSKEQKAIEKRLINQFYAELSDGEITALNEGAKRVKLLQLYAGAAYLDDRSVARFDCTPKLRELRAIKEEAGQLIVFTPFKHTQKFLKEDMEKWGYTVGLINGDVAASKRNKIFNSFQKTHETDILLAHPECMAHGLTLTTSHVIVWWCPVEDAEVYEQANGRIKRISQLFPQVVIHLEGSELEKEIYRRLKSKESMSGLLLALLTSSAYTTTHRR
jgi:hypothetical protein